MSDSPSVLLWMALSALVAGVMNSVAGGGTLLTFPALLAALSPLGSEAAVVANATSTVALAPGSLAGTWGYRKEMRAARRWTLILTPPSLVGGGIGTLLVTHLPPHVFDILVPWLILTAVVLFLIQPTMARLTRPVHTAPASPGMIAAVMLIQFLVAVYGGYFGAGIGILMLSTLAFMGLPHVHEMNAVKTFLAFWIKAVSVVIFVLEGKVFWYYAPIMAATAMLGGYLGARVARRIRAEIMRWVIIATGLGLAACYFHKQLQGGELA